MTRTLLISTVLCTALLTACSDDKGQDTNVNPTNNPATSAEDSAESSGGGVTESDPTNASSATESSNPSNPSDPSSPTTTTPTTASTTPDGTTGSASGADTEETCGFICDTETDGPGPNVQCDVFAQDCADGEKCTAYIEGGESAWNATKCVPVGGEGVPGDTCTSEGGGGTGLDDCQKGAMCWNVNMEGMGVCIELCTGSEVAPMCSDAPACTVVNEGTLNLCLPGCDPLIQNCDGTDLCIPSADVFVCAPDASGEEGQAFDPCEFANVCDKGLYCLNPQYAMECDANAGGCCLPFCDLSEMNAACPGEGQSCTSWFEEGMAPPEYMNVGVCIIPE